MKTRDDLVKEIHDEHTSWNALLAEIGEDRMEEPGAMGNWTFKDLAAHLMFWQEWMLARIEAGPRGRPQAPWPASLGDEDEAVDWDEINAWIYQQHCDRPLSDVLTDMDRSYERFAELIATISEEDLMTRGRFDAMEGKALVEANFFGHLHEEHGTSLHEWLQTG